MNCKPYKPCMFASQGKLCPKKICTFAHSIEELYIPPCNYGVRCSNLYCVYLHNETKDDYFDRTRIICPFPNLLSSSALTSCDDFKNEPLNNVPLKIRVSKVKAIDILSNDLDTGLINIEIILD